MEQFLIYIGKASIAAGAFYLAFLLLFQKHKQFKFNRIYLPVSFLLSFLIPLITFASVRYIETSALNNLEAYSYATAITENMPQPKFVMEWFHYLFGIFVLGLAGFLFNLLLGHLKAIVIIQKSSIVQLFNSTVNLTRKDVHPFSFFNKIVLSEKTIDSPNLEMIIEHEKVHVKEKHTFDILIAEILFLFQWFNPFAWLLKDAVKNNLEFKTDHEIAKRFNPQSYQLAMVALADKKGVAPFLTALNGGQLKNRIIMMKKKTENKYSALKLLVLLPLLAVLVMGLSNKEVRTEFVQVDKTGDRPAIQNMKNKIDQKFFDQIYKDGLLILEDYGVESPLIILNDKVVIEKVIIAETDLKWGEVIQPEQAIEKYGEKGKNGALVFNTESEYVGFKPGQVKQIITGKVTNKKGEPVAAVTVFVKGGQFIVPTDKNGNYEIEVQPNDKVLVFQYLDIDSKEIEIGNKKEINVQLNVEGQPGISGVMFDSSFRVRNKRGELVTPMYVLNGREVNIEDIDPNSIKTFQLFNEESGMEKFGEKGKNGVIVIKAKNASIYQSSKGTETDTLKPPQVVKILKVGGDSLNNALYLVNGVEVETLEDVDPNDIENVDVLKGESATRLYGEKGKNGAVLVTTKDSQKEKIAIGYPSPALTGTTTAPGNSGIDKVGFDFGSFKNVQPYGSPVVIIDGQRYDSVDDAKIDPDDIASISVLKGETASPKIYGEQAKNGVLIINTKTKYNSAKAEPLIIVNGKETTKKVNDIDPETIQSVNVLKEDMAIEKFGEKGKNGVIEITLKPENITTDLKLRRYIAERIKYPVEAQEKGIVGKISMAVTFDKNGKIIKTDKSSPKYDDLDEVVVTASNPGNIQPVQDNNSESLRQEMIRIINLLPAVDIDELKGKTVNIPVKFQLQYNSGNENNTLNNGYDFVVPEGFSPNGDGIHDLFEIKGLAKQFPEFEMKIYNSNRELIWQYKHNGDANKNPNWWDGKDKKNKVKTGNYYYEIKYNDGTSNSTSGILILAK